MTNPYGSLPDYCYWSRSMSLQSPSQIDPVTKARIIGKHENVASMGSCFAQHLSRHIQNSGLNYFVPESAPAEMDQAEANKMNFGVYSARYGNVYTVRQALQLFNRAFGLFVPVDAVWEKGGRFVDALRPNIDPNGFATKAAVEAASAEHLGYVRQVFTKAKWLVFTIGLTEAWQSKQDGTVYPVAPGISGGTFDTDKYEFVNFSVSEVISDLKIFIEKIKQVNPSAAFLLTVSPVPLIATYENRHVLASTTYSKSVLRVAAQEAENSFDDVIYFPSYEIITSPASGGRYYSDDLRQVTDIGVKHVMRVFGRHFIQNETPEEFERIRMQPHSFSDSSVVCDEEAIEKARTESALLK